MKLDLLVRMIAETLEHSCCSSWQPLNYKLSLLSLSEKTQLSCVLTIVPYSLISLN